MHKLWRTKKVVGLLWLVQYGSYLKILVVGRSDFGFSPICYDSCLMNFGEYSYWYFSSPIDGAGVWINFCPVFFEAQKLDLARSAGTGLGIEVTKAWRRRHRTHEAGEYDNDPGYRVSEALIAHNVRWQ